MKIRVQIKIIYRNHIINSSHIEIFDFTFSDTDYSEYFPLNNNPYFVLHRIRRWGFKNKEQACREAKKRFCKIIFYRGV